MELDDLHRLARELLRDHDRGRPEALGRAAPHRADPSKPLKLAGAQHVVAREHGFPTWQRLRAYAERVGLYGELLEHAFHADLAYYDDRADGLLASARDGTPSAVAAFDGDDTPLTTEGARVVVARRHGFATWAALRRHVETLATDGAPFARAYRAVEAGADGTLRQLLDRFPELARAVGTNRNGLLNMATAKGEPGIVALLLERDAEPNRPNAHGWTPLHQAAYADRPDLARMLLDAGAWPELEARGTGGTPLVAALFWGHRSVTEVLAAEGAFPRNLRVAAGLGRLDLIDELVSASGTVAPAAGAARGFYRPHSGFPAWTPSDDPQEVLDEALSWAARSDRVAALEVLVDRGARVDAEVYVGTALAWAAECGRADAVRTLVARGADPAGHDAAAGLLHASD